LQNPVFDFRVNHNGGGYQQQYAEWHGLHNQPKVEGQKSAPSADWGMWVHTMHALVSPEVWFEKHPEYFALRNGARIPDQLCLSNTEVLRITIDALQQKIAQNPAARFWSVSQMDNYNYCQCEHCQAIDQENGSPSGTAVTFANAVAEAFPERVISTLAYQYTRKAPTKVRPLPNVNIMLCSIESDRSRPIADDRAAGSFVHDLEAWSALTGNILVWDYVVNFSHLVGPFPNFHVLKPNLQLFARNRVAMVFEQGFPHDHGEFTELRAYLLSKLMWNPEADADSLMRDFCYGFYGPSGKYVLEYISLATQNLIDSKHSLSLYEPMSAYAKCFLSPEHLRTYFAILECAIEENKGTESYHQRLLLVKQNLLYAWLEVAKSLPFSSGWVLESDKMGGYQVSAQAEERLAELCDISERYGPVMFHEMGFSPGAYCAQMKEYFQYGFQSHLALSKPISFKVPCSPTYPANGPGTLVDGVLGTENYFSLWQGWWGQDLDATIDLGELKKVHSVEVRCMARSLSWIFPAEQMTVFTSSDGTNFELAGQLDNPSASERESMPLVNLKIDFKREKECRFVRINLKNIGELPAWRGVDGDAWLFVDEIMVR
jgi:hypothetical protein